jgi:hypothetical protein
VESILTPLLDLDRWHEFVDDYETTNARRRSKVAAYRAVVDSGRALAIASDVTTGAYTPDPPAEMRVNKADGRKKVVYQYDAHDELLFKMVNRLVQPVADGATSPHCHSFLPGRGARTAFRGLLRDADVAAKACVRLDVSDYFNSIPVRRLLAQLPETVGGDEPLRGLLTRSLTDLRVRRGSAIVRIEHKGVMAGTPLAPLLSNLYLRPLDDEIAATGVTYSRYSDDIIALVDEQDADTTDSLVRARIAAAGLVVNESKSGRSAAGAPWDYLGFRYSAGTIDVAANAQRKFRGKTTRLSRKLDRHRVRYDLTAEEVVERFVRRINRSLFGVPVDADGFCWSTWFFPVLTTARTLDALDAHAQQKLRYAATGRHNARARKLVPYESLRAAGYLPLVAAWHAHRRGRDDYDELVATRCAPQSNDERVA